MMLTELLPTKIVSGDSTFHIFFNPALEGVDVTYKNNDQEYLVCKVSNMSPLLTDVTTLRNVFTALLGANIVLVSGNYSLTITEFLERLDNYESDLLTGSKRANT